MSNSYFQFKQFKIEQDKSAMKVCTDSCLFGAWISIDENIESILDIGTGTGLLSLMLAQKSKAKIIGIEIDENAYLQTKVNFENSIWKDRLQAQFGDVRNTQITQKFDFIVCNPPFYENEMHSKQQGEKIAKHSVHLSLFELMTTINNLIYTNKETSKFAILLPYFRKEEMEKLASEFRFYPIKTILIKQSPNHHFFRYAAIFSRNKNELPIHDEICIKNYHHQYSSEAVDLLKPYYLYL